MLYSGTDPESYITENDSVYEDYVQDAGYTPREGLQGYLAHKKQPPHLRAAMGP